MAAVVPWIMLQALSNRTIRNWSERRATTVSIGRTDPDAEQALYDICSMRTFAGLELGSRCDSRQGLRHLLKRYELTKAVFATIAELLEANGAQRCGTIDDATLIAALPSTNNKA